MLSSALSGVAGVYFVAAEMSRLGLIALVTVRNTKGVDILASSDDAQRFVGVEVKTVQGSRTEWLISKGVEELKDAANRVFVFVALNERGSPSYYIVPGHDVAVYAMTSHQKWLAGAAAGRERADGSMRKFRMEKPEEYHNKWELLGLGSGGAVGVKIESRTGLSLSAAAGLLLWPGTLNCCSSRSFSPWPVLEAVRVSNIAPILLLFCPERFGTTAPAQ